MGDSTKRDIDEFQLIKMELRAKKGGDEYWYIYQNKQGTKLDPKYKERPEFEFESWYKTDEIIEKAATKAQTIEETTPKKDNKKKNK